jgi:hypothetical protein
VLGKTLVEVLVANPLIGAEQANLVRNGFIHESFQRRSVDVFDDAGDDVSLALHGADHNGRAGSPDSYFNELG